MYIRILRQRKVLWDGEKVQTVITKGKYIILEKRCTRIRKNRPGLGLVNTGTKGLSIRTDKI